MYAAFFYMGSHVRFDLMQLHNSIQEILGDTVNSRTPEMSSL